MTTALSTFKMGSFPSIEGGIGGAAQSIPVLAANLQTLAARLIAVGDKVNTVIAEVVAVNAATTAYTQTYATADRTHAAPTAAVAALTATNPDAITEYTPHASGAVPVISEAATDLDTTAAALNTLVDECQALEIIVSADVADMVTQKGILDALIVDVADLKQLVNAIIDDLQGKAILT